MFRAYCGAITEYAPLQIRRGEPGYVTLGIAVRFLIHLYTKTDSGLLLCVLFA